MPLTPTERTMRAKIAANARWANTRDRVAATQNWRDAWLEKLADDIDPDHQLPEEERRRRAEYARKAHMQRMALKTAKARRKKAANATDGGPESRRSVKTEDTTLDARPS